jgi:hypothetical protein
MLARARSNSFLVKAALTRAVQFAGRSTGQGDNKALNASVPRVLDHRLPHRHSQNTNGLPQVRLNHDAFERFKVGLLAEYMHPADGSVQDVIDKASRCYSRCSWHVDIC